MNKCSFCGRKKPEAKKIIVGFNVYICDFCVILCNKIIKNDISDKKTNFKFKPKEIKNKLDDYIVGQNDAKKILSVSVYNHYKRIKNEKIFKSNILMIGPTGSGKTLLAKTISKYINVPFSISDATSLTEAGYVGEDVENILYKLLCSCDFNVKKAEYGIVYIDEIDKISKKENNSSRDVSGEGVQQALLKIIEGTISSITPKGIRKFTNQDNIQINTTNILFICGGAFNGIYTKNNSCGFIKKRNINIIDPRHLVKYGLIPEFVGRFSLITMLKKLKVKDLIKILKVPKNSFLNQYIILFKMEGIKIVFKKSFIKKIAKLAYKIDMGARGLKYLLDKNLVKYMYNSPGKKIKKIVIKKAKGI
ncbi:ATP-dependent Clp protease ATP-binding subunit ClpX [Candidatus Vidania fulgoroideorum]